MVGWVESDKAASQSLARDLSLSPTRELLQQFVPELQTLRQSPPTTLTYGGGDLHVPSTAQIEVVAEFTINVAAGPPTATHRVGLEVLGDRRHGNRSTQVWAMCGPGTCTAGIDVTTQGGRSYSAPLPVSPTPAGPGANASVVRLLLHVYVDGNIVEAIFCNRTAFVAVANASQVPSATTVALLPAGPGTDNAVATVHELTPVNNLREAE